MQNLKNILIIDIETASIHEEFGSLSERMQKQWERKAQFIRNEDELNTDELFFERAAIYAEFGKIITIAAGIFHKDESGDVHLRVKSFKNDNEEELLKEFKQLLETGFDSDRLRLCAHNGKEFDYPYICRRMLVNGIKIPTVLDIRNRKPWEILHLDTMEMWKFGDRKSFTSLELLTALFDIKSSKEDIDGSQVNEVYYKESGLDRISKYCQNDVVATAQLFLRLNEMPLVAEENITILD